MMRLETLSFHRHGYLLVCLLLAPICAFSPLIAVSRFQLKSHRSLLCASVHDQNGDDPDDNWLDAPSDNVQPSSFASRSQMPQFIDAFLQKERESRGDVRPDIFTHMIGIPMTECHQLQIELESVQRAILYHCPSLIHACIVPSMSRMPLLYVDASREPAGSVTMELHNMVRTVVQNHFFVKEEAEVGDEASYSGVNAQGYKPLTMTFHKLQIDGENNEALFTVADRDSAGGIARLQGMVADLQVAIESRGWKCQWPPSDVQGMQDREALANCNEFIPRIPLMRLPPNFESYLRPLVDDDDRRTSEDGGNGISPVFWIKWEKDVMGSNVRLREVGIYPRRPGLSGLDEQTFYLPHETVTLPAGNDALSQQEKVHQDYTEQRMKESERRLKEEDSEELSPTGDFMDPSLADNRKILESIYGKDSEIFNEGFLQSFQGDDDEEIMPSDVGGSPALSDDGIDDRFKTKIRNDLREPTAERDRNLETITRGDSNQKSPPLENWMQDRIRNIIENRPSQQPRGTADVKANIPSPDDNPIFQAYRNGSWMSSSKATNRDVSESVLPDFPSEELLRGFWKVIRSPLQSTIERKDESRSDNFVLRVDGTVSGGPVLDQETFNKASGGTWRMLESIDETLLRIRLVIPPKKDRIMVWEGEVYKEAEGMYNSASILDATSFGRAMQDTKGDEIIKCSGTVWTEDAVTKRNRQDLGSFVLHKVNTSSDPRDFTITIPKSVRNQD